jgi:threonine dehydrogenase-like Zn-dependent dehydrogenase
MLSLNIEKNKLKIINIKRPEIYESHEAIIMVTSSTISERDRFFEYYTKPINYVPGSEFAGHVVEIGSDVNKFDINDLVINNSKIEASQHIFFGTPKLPGGHAEYVKIPHADKNLIKINPAIEERAVLLGGDYSSGYYSIENFLKSHPNTKTFTTYGFYNSTIGAIHYLLKEHNYNIHTKEKNIFKKKIFGNLVDKVYPSKIPVSDALVVGLIEDQNDLYNTIIENDFKKIIFIEEQSASLFMSKYKIKKNIIFITDPPATKKVELLVQRLLVKSIELTALVSHVIPIQDSVNAYKLYKKENTTSVVLKP